MWHRTLGCVLFVALACVVIPPAHAQDCPVTRPRSLIPAVAPVVGASPMWLTTGSKPLTWAAADQAVEILWVRDRAVLGPVIVSGQAQASQAKVRFGALGSSAGFGVEKYRFDQLGMKPRTATQADLQKYTFHTTSAHFPEPGCYEITAQVGREKAIIYLNLQKSASK